jgi:cytidine deaminase
MARICTSTGPSGASGWAICRVDVAQAESASDRATNANFLMTFLVIASVAKQSRLDRRVAFGSSQRRQGLSSEIEGCMTGHMNEEQLIAAARKAALQAYAPYSRFFVGCAIESIDGSVVIGVNVENACYRLGVCAEQSALSAAHLAFGLANVARIAVAGGDGSGESLAGGIVCTPCGGCRQAIYETSCLSGRDIDIICSSGDGESVERHKLSTLIPYGFGPANLEDAD